MYTMDPQHRIPDWRVCRMCEDRLHVPLSRYLNHKVTDATLTRMGDECTFDLQALFDPWGHGFTAHGPVYVKFVRNPDDPNSVVAVWPEWLQRLAE